MLTAEVDRYINKHHLIQPDSKVMVGVSGGPDSMALLHYLLVKRKTYRLDLVAVIIEHGLRGEESKQDRDYVQAFCQKNNIAFDTKSIDVNRYKEKYKLGTQVAARTLRYQAFDELMKKHQSDYLALAHHADDQVETVYMRLTRGTQLEGLQGMSHSRAFSTGKIIRPFLSITKEMIEHYCQENNIIPRLDPSNEEDTYTRNYFRLHVLPLLRKKNPNLTDTILHMTEKIADDSHYLTEQAKKASEKVLHFSKKPKKVTTQITALKSYPLALQRRLFHLILDYLYETLPESLNYRHENQFVELINSDRANASIDLPAELQMKKAYQSLIFCFKQDEKEAYQYPLTVPGQTILTDPSLSITTELVEKKERLPQNNSTYYLPIKQGEIPSLTVRTRLPGDRIYLAHINGRKKVKSIFIDKKIPLDKRDHWPILVRDQEEVLWIIGLEKSDQIKQKDQYLKITYHKET